jgi:hypothetical protein
MTIEKIHFTPFPKYDHFYVLTYKVKKVTCDLKKLPNYDILAPPSSFFSFLDRMSVTYIAGDI